MDHGLRLDRNVEKYVAFLQRSRCQVFLGWLMVTLLLGIFGARRLMGLTHNAFHPPPGSPSAIAKAKIRESFPGSGKRHTDIIYFETPENSLVSILDNGLLMDLTNASEAYLRSHLPEHLYTGITFSSYYSYLNQGMPSHVASLAFVGHGNRSSFMLMQYPKQFTIKYGHALQSLHKWLNARFVGHGKASFIGDVGVAYQAVEAVQAATESMMHMDLISVPIAFVVLAYTLRSARLLVLPLITLLVSVITAFGVMGLLAQTGVDVSSATPPLMMSMILAVSIDYALFLLTRFKEEVEQGNDIELVIKRMLIYSGHTVCGSGFTLAFCFLALLFFPLQMIQSIGLGVIVSIFSAIVVNLTLVPAALLAAPSFFSSFEKCGCSCRAGSVQPSQEAIMSPRSLEKPFESEAWFRFAMFSTSPCATGLVLLLVGVLGLASLVKFTHLNNSMDTLLMAPRDSVSVDTMLRFGHSFSKGKTGPYKLLLLPKQHGSIYENPSFWPDATNLLRDIVTETYTGESRTHGTVTSVMYSYNMDGKQKEMNASMDYASFLDPAIHDDKECSQLNGTYAPFRDDCIRFVKSKDCKDLGVLAPAMAMRFSVTTEEVLGACGLAQITLRGTTSQTRDALFATLVPSVPMGSEEAVSWTKACRAVLSQSSKKYPNVEAHLQGFTTDMVDAIDAIDHRAPAVLVITMAMCFVLITFLVISLAFGLSSVLLITWTIVVVFAIGTLVYQDGVFGSHAPRQLAGTNGLAWIVPPLTFTIILGLGLDYDIFLLGRVCEYRCNGYDDKEAIAYGVAKTGPVITSAGIIMAVAFGGLMMSDVPMLNQISLLLVVAVLIDTFFIRSLATPAVHAPLRSLNWWPRQVPAPTLRRSNSICLGEVPPSSDVA